MGKKHLKTLTVPVSWPVKRKSTKFTLRPKPGKSFIFSLPVLLVFKNMLKYAKTLKEVKAILMDKEVMIDQTRVKDPKKLLGLMDVLSITVSKEDYRLLIKKSGKLYLKKISAKDAKTKVCKVIGKTKLKGDRLQLNLFDSRNIIVKKDEAKIGDSVLISLPDQKISKVLKLEKGAYVYLISGGHKGEHGTVEEIFGETLTITSDKNKFDTPKRSAIVVGKSKSEIELE